MRILSRRVLLISIAGLLAGAALAPAASPSCASAVRFDFEPKVAIAAGLKGKLILRPVEGEAEPLELPAQVGTPVMTELPCSSKWEATPTFPGTWGPRVLVVAGDSGSTTVSRVTLWPLGKIAGATKLPAKEERLPKKLSVTTLAPRPPAPRDLPKGLLDCPIDIQGKWQCPPLPAATFDLVISAEGFIPQYRWGVKVAAGKTTDLGAVDLKHGASVAGWVEVEEGTLSGNCHARLTPLMAPGSGAGIAEKIRSTTREVPVRRDGFFQLVDVAPGNYSLEVRQPGFAATTVQPLEVWPRSETFLREPVTLKRPLQVELAITPPIDWLGRPWKVLVFRISDAVPTHNTGPLFQGSADAQGLVTLSGQGPGRFRVSVTDALDNQLYLREIRVSGPEDARQEIALKILTVRGIVTLGKDPLAATLWFGGRHGGTSVKFESDRDGKFHGVLPSDGWWEVEVASLAPKFETRTRVKVEGDGQDRARADVTLPATRVFGKVVTDAGDPAPGAAVSLATADEEVTSTADDAGSFEVRGLTPGMGYVAATKGSAQGTWSSDRLAFFVHDDAEVGPLELRMHKNKRLTGMIQSSRGPVPGAGITVIPLRPNMAFGDVARTELDGGFSVQVPASTEVADVIVSPPGYALHAFAVPLAGETAPSLTVSEEGGSLEVLFPEKPNDAEKDAISLWIFQNGLPLPPNDLYRWITSHGKEIGGGKKLAVPQLAPGEYRACLVSQAVVVPWEASGFTAPLAKCAAGELGAGSTLQLDLSQQQR